MKELVRLVLICAMAFFASVDPWAAISGVRATTTSAFVWFSSVAIVTTLLGVWRPFPRIPKLLAFFSLYLFIHISVQLFILAPSSIWDPVGSEAMKLGVLQEPVIALAARLFFFVLVGYALTALVNSTTAFLCFAVAYSLGVATAALAVGGILEDEFTGGRLMGDYGDPNVFGLAACGAVFLLVASWRRTTSKILRVFTAVLLIVSAAAALASGSRGALVGGALGVAAMIVSTSRLRSRASAVAAAVAVAAVVAAVLPTNVLEMNRARSSLDEIRETRGSQRLDIWSAYLESIPKYIALGAGLGRAAEVVEHTDARTYDPHNTYLSLLAEFGGLGFALFALAQLQIANGLRKAERLPESAWVAAIVGLWGAWLTQSFAMDTMATRQTWLILAVTVRAAAQGAIHSRPHVPLRRTW